MRTGGGNKTVVVAGLQRATVREPDGAGFVSLSLGASGEDSGVSTAPREQLPSREEQKEGPGARGLGRRCRGGFDTVKEKAYTAALCMALLLWSQPWFNPTSTTYWGTSLNLPGPWFPLL